MSEQWEHKKLKFVIKKQFHKIFAGRYKETFHHAAYTTRRTHLLITSYEHRKILWPKAVYYKICTVLKLIELTHQWQKPKQQICQRWVQLSNRVDCHFPHRQSKAASHTSTKSLLGQNGRKNTMFVSKFNKCIPKFLSLIHIWRCRRSYACRSRWSPYH